MYIEHTGSPLLIYFKEYHKNEMKKKWKTLFATGSGADWDNVSELPSNIPIRKTRRTHYTPFQDWNGVVAPAEKMRVEDPVDVNMVTVTVKSSSPNAMVEINKAEDLEHSGRKTTSNGRYKKNIAVIPDPLPPHMTYGSHSVLPGYGNHTGQVLYPPISSSQ